LVRVENLSYTADNGEKLFENVSFIIHKNEKAVLVGEDDVAKTKLLEIMNGTTEATSGTIT